MKRIRKRNLRTWGRRILSFVLTAAMMLTLIPESVYATGVQADNYGEVTYTSGDFEIIYKETASWDNYVNVDVTVKNNGKNAVEPWKLDLEYEGTISNIWNADVETVGQGKIHITAKSYNAKLDVDNSVSFGFTAYGDNVKPDYPTGIIVEVENAGTETEETTEEKDNSSTANTVTEKPVTGLDYALFTSGDETLSLYTNQTNICGDIHSNKGFYYQGTSIRVDGTIEAADTVELKTSSGEDCRKVRHKTEHAGILEMPDITKELYDYCTENGTVYEQATDFDSDNIVIDKPVAVNGSTSFNSTTFLGKGIVYAKDSVSYNVGSLSTPEDSRVLIAAEKGSITLNGSDITLDAVLYAPNGTVSINANNVNINGRIIAKQVKINGTKVNINAGPHDLDMLDFILKPEMKLIVTGNKKENRKITMDVKAVSDDGNSPAGDTVWSITREGAEDDNACMVDEEASGAFHKEMIFKEAGLYHVSVKIINKNAEYTVTEDLVVEKDIEPSAAFRLEQGYYSRDEDGNAEITVHDASDSPDGDVIGQRIWKVYYDADDNGEFDEEEAAVYSDDNDTEIIINTDKVGHYKVTLMVREIFSDTIPKLVTEDAFLVDDTSGYDMESCVFEVGN